MPEMIVSIFALFGLMMFGAIATVTVMILFLINGTDKQ